MRGRLAPIHGYGMPMGSSSADWLQTIWEIQELNLSHGEVWAEGQLSKPTPIGKSEAIWLCVMPTRSGCLWLECEAKIWKDVLLLLVIYGIKPSTGHLRLWCLANGCFRGFKWLDMLWDCQALVTRWVFLAHSVFCNFLVLSKEDIWSSSLVFSPTSLIHFLYLKIIMNHLFQKLKLLGRGTWMVLYFNKNIGIGAVIASVANDEFI